MGDRFALTPTFPIREMFYNASGNTFWWRTLFLFYVVNLLLLLKQADQLVR